MSSTKQVRLRAHGDHVWEECLVVHPDLFPDLSVGDTLEIFSAKEPNRKLYQQVDLIATKGKHSPPIVDHYKATVQISLKESLYKSFNVEGMVNVRLVPKVVMS